MHHCEIKDCNVLFDDRISSLAFHECLNLPNYGLYNYHLLIEYTILSLLCLYFI